MAISSGCLYLIELLIDRYDFVFEKKNCDVSVMTLDVRSELFDGVEVSTRRLDFTRMAFQMLPSLDRPNILDIGCGDGEPTLELARLSDGTVTGIDIEQGQLDKLMMRARERRLQDRVKAVRMSMRNLDFTEEHFDVIWVEGAIWVMGFENGLVEWKKYIKPRGFLVVHEMCWLKPDPPAEISSYWHGLYPGITTADKMIDIIQEYGYVVLGHFKLPDDFWWEGYYEALQNKIVELRERYRGDAQAQNILDSEQSQVDIYHRNMHYYGSAFFVMQKK